MIATLSTLAARIAKEREVNKLIALSIEFQKLVVETGGSKRLRAFFSPLSHIVRGNFFVTIPGFEEVTRRGVAAIARAIAAGEPEAAEQACWWPIDEVGELVAQRFR